MKKRTTLGVSASGAKEDIQMGAIESPTMTEEQQQNSGQISILQHVEIVWYQQLKWSISTTDLIYMFVLNTYI